MKPIAVKVGSVTVKIYHAPTVVSGKSYDAYLVRYHHGDELKQRKFALLEGDDSDKCARAYALKMARALSTGKIMAAAIDNSDAVIYRRAQEVLAPFGKSVDVAAIEYAEIIKTLGNVPPIEVARDYRRRHPEGFVSKTLREVLDEMASHKTADGLSSEWVRNLKMNCGAFVKHFGETSFIAALNGVAIDSWLRALDVEPRTRNNYRGSIRTFLNFAKSKKYLPKDFDEMSYVKTAKEINDEISIYTPDELLKMLNASDGALFRFIAFGAFAGLRSSEIARLDWSRVRDDGIEVFGKHPRTPQRRIAPFLEPLKVLFKNRKTAGKVWTSGKENPSDKALRALEDRSGVKWKRNALRHSFISYRLAIIKNTAAVALECGNSEAKIFKNYRQLVTETAAKEWFEIYKSVTKSKKPSVEQPEKQHFDTENKG